MRFHARCGVVWCGTSHRCSSVTAASEFSCHRVHQGRRTAGRSEYIESRAEHEHVQIESGSVPALDRDSGLGGATSFSSYCCALVACGTYNSSVPAGAVRPVVCVRLATARHDLTAGAAAAEGPLRSPPPSRSSRFLAFRPGVAFR